MKANAHKETFFQTIHVCFSLALRENKSTTAHALKFFQSIHMCFSLAPCGNSTKYAHTDIFFSPLLAFFSSTMWARGNLALLCIHRHFAVHHIGFCETSTYAVISVVT